MSEYYIEEPWSIHGKRRITSTKGNNSMEEMVNMLNNHDNIVRKVNELESSVKNHKRALTELAEWYADDVGTGVTVDELIEAAFEESNKNKSVGQ